MLMEAWPSISETIFELTFLERSSMAHVWPRSWKRTGWSFAALRSRPQERLRRFDGLMKVPASVAKMRPPG